MTSLINLRENSPFRPVDWRWLKARRLLADDKKPNRKYDDTYVVMAYRFQKELFGIENEWDQLNVLERFPDLYDAFQVYNGETSLTDSSISDSAIRSDIEARLLAKDSTNEAISDRTFIKLDSIDIYEKVFFNVRDRLNNRSWLMNHVIGANIHKSINDTDIDLLWKLFAINGGMRVLDDMVDVLSELITPEESLTKYYRSHNRHVISRRSLISAITIRAKNDQYIRLSLIEMGNKLLEIDQQAGEDQVSDDKLLATMNDVVSRLKISKSSRDNPPTCLMQSGSEERVYLQITDTTNKDTIIERQSTAKFPTAEDKINEDKEELIINPSDL